MCRIIFLCLIFGFITSLAFPAYGEFNLKEYRDQNKHEYGNANLTIVAKDIYYKHFYDDFSTFNEFLRETGLDKQLKEHQKIEKAQSSVNSDQLVYGYDSEYFWAILIISFVITWSVGLVPPLVIRFLIIKRPISKWATIIVITCFYIINVIFFTLLGSQNKHHAALFLVAMVSYYILRKSNKLSGLPIESRR